MVPTAVLLVVVASLSQARNIPHDPALIRGEDLTRFVSRPDIRAPQWRVDKYVTDDIIAPGYWFVGPYAEWYSAPDRNEYSPYQVGPHIYDGQGDLIWSGAELDRNRNAFDFRTYQDGDETLLSYVLGPLSNSQDVDAGGLFITMGDDYNKTRMISRLNGSRHDINFHEFSILPGSAEALAFSSKPVTTHEIPLDNSTLTPVDKHYAEDCVVEFNVDTSEKSFEWCPMANGITPDDSYDSRHITVNWQDWDYIHLNSIDKFDNGDYLVSARHVNALYRISPSVNGTVWQLGGKRSSFPSIDFNFSSQHDARIVSDNATTTIISLMDNASDDQWRQPDSANVSSAKLFALHPLEDPPRAELLLEIPRPDGHLSRKRGNVQLLPNGNIFVCWSEGGYQTEHLPTGELVLAARFSSYRFSTYRTHKAAGFVGRPSEPIALVVRAYATPSDAVTAAWVSWNGATEAAAWRFVGRRDGVADAVVNAKTSTGLEDMATVARAGFETTLTVAGRWKDVSALALDAAGNVLGQSAAVQPEVSAGGVGGDAAAAAAAAAESDAVAVDEDEYASDVVPAEYDVSKQEGEVAAADGAAGQTMPEDDDVRAGEAEHDTVAAQHGGPTARPAAAKGMLAKAAELLGKRPASALGLVCGSVLLTLVGQGLLGLVFVLFRRVARGRDSGDIRLRTAGEEGDMEDGVPLMRTDPKKDEVLVRQDSFDMANGRVE